jgi:glycerol-1-phosphate dehydrogenase [NAD(P)+]
MTLAQLNELLAQRCDAEWVWIGEDIMAPLARFITLQPGGPSHRRLLLIADPVTWNIAGKAIDNHLLEAGHTVSRHLLSSSRAGGKAACDDEEVGLAVNQIRASDCDLVIAVGAGTVNDVAKLAAFRSERPYLVVATAPSMNGYTSSTAAVLSSGIKESAPCRGPIACVADINLLCNAPYRMIAAGLGDLVSRTVSMADWYLSHRVLGTGYSTLAIDLVEESGRLCDGLGGEKLPQRNSVAVARLMGALLISGQAMAQAGSSAPASGAEHLISHYLDMTRDPRQPGELHGCQVGVATIATAACYELLLAVEPTSSLNLAKRTASMPSWPQVEEELSLHFGELAPALLPHAREKNLSSVELHQRLVRMASEWPSIRAGLSPLLRPASAVREQLSSAGAPVSFAAIGVDAVRARDALWYCRHIRARYTVLDLAADIGVLQDWTTALPLC